MLREKIKDLVKTYEAVVKVVDKKATEDEVRAYGGVIRSVKGWLQEYLTEEIILLAWKEINGDESRLKIDSKKHKIPIKKDYVEKLPDGDIKYHILSNLDDCWYGLSVDKQVYVDGEFVLGIECKAYTENAMLKRILVDFSLLKKVFPKIHCYLFQLESQLGGDYSELKELTLGSTSSHTLMSYFPNVKLNIFTFLKGERKVDRPIHKYEYFKPITEDRLNRAVMLLAESLKEFI